ncbi:MAG: hypothetical protein ABSB73_11700 [Solirubrobacteraceae bacterium]|jgi:hypothetical protein
MRAPAPDADPAARVAAGEPRPHPEEPAAEDELIMHLERDQFVAETSRPVSRAALTQRAVIALWALRVFAIVVSLMVIYTFIEQLN